MTNQQPAPMPTEEELRILKVLWKRGSATVKELHDELNAHKRPPKVMTTTAKQLEIMMAKQLVARSGERRPFVYTATVERGATQQRYVKNVLNNVFDRSASGFMLSALASGSVDAEEIASIKAMLEEFEKDERP